MIDLDPRNLIELEKFFRKSPRLAAKATGMVLNNMAFESMPSIRDVIKKNMTIRNKSLIRAAIRVNKNREWRDISRQVSEVGSVEKPRFTGWEEQVTGRQAKRERTFAYAARTGARRGGTVRKKFRAKRNFLRPHDLGVGSTGAQSSHHLAAVMLIWTRRNKWKEPFMLYGHRKIESGIFYWKGKKLKRLHHFKKFEVERLQWMAMAMDGYLKEANLQTMWAKVLDRMFKPAMKWPGA